MVIPISSFRPRQLAERAMLTTELVVAMAILASTVLPLGYAYVRDARYLRSLYQRAVAMEILDGEIETLAAGAWQSFSEGTQPYSVRAEAATNLPPGEFQLTRTGKHLRLEWKSKSHRGIGPVVREVTVK